MEKIKFYKDLKIAIVTAIYNNYDNLNNICINSNIDYICFTENRNIEPKGWSLFFLPNLSTNRKGSSFIKYIKSHLDIYLNEYDYVIWCDGNIKILNFDLIKLMVDSFRDTEILMFKHYDPNPNLFRKCVYEEAHFAKNFNKYSKERLDQQINDYHNDKYPTNNGLFQSGIYLQNNKSPKVNMFHKTWYEQIIKYGVYYPMCQVSLPYALWKANIHYNVIDHNIYNSNMISINLHN